MVKVTFSNHCVFLCKIRYKLYSGKYNTSLLAFGFFVVKNIGPMLSHREAVKSASSLKQLIK